MSVAFIAPGNCPPLELFIEQHLGEDVISLPKTVRETIDFNPLKHVILVYAAAARTIRLPHIFEIVILSQLLIHKL